MDTKNPNSPYALPEFPTEYTESDKKRQEELRLKEADLKEIYHADYTKEAWESKPLAERIARRGIQPLENVPVLGKLMPSLTPERAELERLELEKELNELNRKAYVVERIPQVQDQLRAMALSGSPITDPTTLNSIFKDIDNRLTKEEREYLVRYAHAVANADKSSLIDGTFWRGDAESTDFYNFFRSNELNPQHIMSTVAFSKDVDEIQQTLMQAYPPDPATYLDDDAARQKQLDDIKVLAEKYGVDFDPDNLQSTLTNLSKATVAIDGVPHDFRDISGEVFTGILIPPDTDTGEKFSQAWVDGEFIGYYDEERGTFINVDPRTGNEIQSLEEMDTATALRNIAISNVTQMRFSLGGTAIDSVISSLAYVRDSMLTYFDKLNASHVSRYGDTYWGKSIEDRWYADLEKTYSAAMQYVSDLRLRNIEKKEEWFKANPEYASPYVEPAMEKIANEGWTSLFTDKKYFAALFVETGTSVALSMGTMVALTAITKNPILAASASGFLWGGSEAGSVSEELIQSGMSPEEAAKYSAAIAPILGALEGATETLMLKYFFPNFYKQSVRKELTKEILRLSKREIAKRGIQAATIGEITEVVTETLQEATQNVSLVVAGQLDDWTSNLDEIAVRTAVGMLPLTFAGGGSHSLTLQRNMSEAQKAGVWERADTLMAEGVPEDVANTRAVMEWLATKEGLRVRTQTEQELRPVIERELNSSTTIQSIHGIESTLTMNTTINKALRKQIHSLRGSIRGRETTIAATLDETKKAQREAKVAELREMLQTLEAQQLAVETSIVEARDSLHKLDLEAEHEGLVTKRAWDRLPPDARKVYTDRAGLTTDTVVKEWDDMTPLERASLQGISPRRIAVTLPELPNVTWDAMTPEQRVVMANDIGMAHTTQGRTWDELTSMQQDMVTLELENRMVRPPTYTTKPTGRIVTRIGELSEDGAYFGLEGTQYELGVDSFVRPLNSIMGGKRAQYILDSDIKIADTRDTIVAKELIAETLKDSRINESERTRLQQELELFQDEALEGQAIDYMLFDETPMADAAGRLGYDAVQVMENSDWPGEATSLFVMNMDKVSEYVALPTYTTSGAVPVQTTTQIAEIEAEYIEAMNKTSRGGSFSAQAVVPRLVAQTSSKSETILDFGAGKEAAHTISMNKEGFNVTAYEIGNNVVEGLHDTAALERTYDTVMASNVLNVAPNESVLRYTLSNIAKAVSPTGRAVFNYPLSPRSAGLSSAQVLSIVKEFFSDVVVGGTKQAPVWEARSPIHLTIPSLESARFHGTYDIDAVVSIVNDGLREGSNISTSEGQASSYPIILEFGPVKGKPVDYHPGDSVAQESPKPTAIYIDRGEFRESKSVAEVEKELLKESNSLEAQNSNLEEFVSLTDKEQKATNRELYTLLQELDKAMEREIKFGTPDPNAKTFNQQVEELKGKVTIPVLDLVRDEDGDVDWAATRQPLAEGPATMAIPSQATQTVAEPTPTLRVEYVPTPITSIADITFSDDVTDTIRQQVREALEDIQKVLRVDVAEVVIDPTIDTKWNAAGAYYNNTKTIKLASSDPAYFEGHGITVKQTIFHEMCHNLSSQDIESGRFILWDGVDPQMGINLRAWIKEVKESTDPKVIADVKKVSLYWYLYNNHTDFRTAEESFAQSFSNYMEGVTSVPSRYIEILEEFFPLPYLRARHHIIMQLNALSESRDSTLSYLNKTVTKATEQKEAVDKMETLLSEEKFQEASTIYLKNFSLFTITARDTWVKDFVALLENDPSMKENVLKQVKSDLRNNTASINAANKSVKHIDGRIAFFSKRMDYLDNHRDTADIAPPTMAHDPNNFPRSQEGLARIPSIDAERASINTALADNPTVRDYQTRTKDITDIPDKSINYNKLSGLPVFGKVLSGTLDSKYIFANLQTVTGLDWLRVFDHIRKIHGQVKQAADIHLSKVRKHPMLLKLAQNEVALDRIESIINHRRDATKFPLPQDVSEHEQHLADIIIEIFQHYESKVSILAFERAYKLSKDPKSIAKELKLDESLLGDINHAIDLTRRGNLQARDAFLANTRWGLIEGYTPWMITDISLGRGTFPMSSTRGEARLMQRNGVEIPNMDKTLMQRLDTYIHQIEAQWQMREALTEVEHLFETSKSKFIDAASLADDLTIMLEELQHLPPREINRPGSVTMIRAQRMFAAAIFNHPLMLTRNFMQALVYHPFRSELIHPLRNVPIDVQTKAGVVYRSIVGQLTGINRSMFYHGYKPLFADLPIVGKPYEALVRMVSDLQLYGYSDDIPRHRSFNAGMGKAYRAIESYKQHRDVGRLVKESGAYLLQKPLQDRFLDYIALGDTKTNWGIEGLQELSGYESAAIHMGTEVADMTHFNYERWMRAPIEHGDKGRTVFNLLTYTRGYWTRHYLNAKKAFDSTAPINERIGAFKDTAAMIFVGAIVAAYMEELTGRRYKSYWVGDIMWWELGGLAIGGFNDLLLTAKETALIIDPAVDTDERGKAAYRLVKALHRSAEMTVPFYRNFISTLEAATGYDGIEVKGAGMLREILDSNYTQPQVDKLEYSLLEKMTKALYDATPPDPLVVESAYQTLQESREKVGMVDPQTGQTYSLSNFLGDVRSQTKGVPRDMIVEENGFDTLAVFAMDYLDYLDEFDDLPTRGNAREQYRKDNPLFEAMMLFWERYEKTVLPASQAGSLVETSKVWDATYDIDPQVARKRFANWQVAQLME